MAPPKQKGRASAPSDIRTAARRAAQTAAFTNAAGSAKAMGRASLSTRSNCDTRAQRGTSIGTKTGADRLKNDQLLVQREARRQQLLQGQRHASTSRRSNPAVNQSRPAGRGVASAASLAVPAPENLPSNSGARPRASSAMTEKRPREVEDAHGRGRASSDDVVTRELRAHAMDVDADAQARSGGTRVRYGADAARAGAYLDDEEGSSAESSVESADEQDVGAEAGGRGKAAQDGSAGRDYGEASRQIMSNISVIIKKLVLSNSGEDTALARFNSLKDIVEQAFEGLASVGSAYTAPLTEILDASASIVQSKADADQAWVATAEVFDKIETHIQRIEHLLRTRKQRREAFLREGRELIADFETRMDASNRKYTAVHDTIVKQALDSAKNKQHEKEMRDAVIGMLRSMS